ncbi:MAG TPA: hypothetical protein VI603_01150 [Saprospiraceae bacterium]|nr:hypothetical protein [Saprospiraceae bacterium]
MKKCQLGFIVMITGCLVVQAQSKTASDQVVDQLVEGGKVLVELIKVIGSDKGKDEDAGCKDRYADLCITNARDTSLTIAMTHRTSEEHRELIIAEAGEECSLQLPVGVWTYDLKVTGSMTSMRKGDLLIEGCNNVTMTIK